MRVAGAVVLIGLLLSGALAAAAPKVVVLEMQALGQELNIWCWAAVSEMVLSHQYDRAAGDLPKDLRQCQIVDYTVKMHAKFACEREREACDLEKDTGQTALLAGQSFRSACEPAKSACDRARVACSEIPQISCCNTEFSEAERCHCMQTGAPVYGLDAQGALPDWPWKRVKSTWYNDELTKDCGWNEASKSWENCLPEAGITWQDLMAELDKGQPVVFSWRFENGDSHIMVATGYVSKPMPKGVPDLRWVVVNDPWPPKWGTRYMVPFDDIFKQGIFENYWYQWKIAP